MLKRLLSFFPIPCANYPNQNTLPGDLLFYRASSVLKALSSPIAAITAACDEPIYHIAMVIDSKPNRISIIESTPKDGVFVSTYRSVCAAEGALSTIEVRRVNAHKSITNKAVEIATKYIGEPYNDIFAHNFINSKGEHSFYCSQLIQHAYNEAAASIIFQFVPMIFSGDDSKTTSFWMEYYKNLGVAEVPEGDGGSRPCEMYNADFLIDLV